MLTNTRKGEHSDVISDQWTEFYQKRSSQMDFSRVPSIFKEIFMVEDSHREKTPSNKTPALTKSMNMNMIHQINSL